MNNDIKYEPELTHKKLTYRINTHADNTYSISIEWPAGYDHGVKCTDGIELPNLFDNEQVAINFAHGHYARHKIKSSAVVELETK